MRSVYEACVQYGAMISMTPMMIASKTKMASGLLSQLTTHLTERYSRQAGDVQGEYLCQRK